jgi:hypothetical protein
MQDILWFTAGTDGGKGLNRKAQLALQAKLSERLGNMVGSDSLPSEIVMRALQLKANRESANTSSSIWITP